MAKNYGSDLDESISEINVVPLVDIILVVLIIFMVTAPMIMKPSINVNLPKAGSGDKTAPTQLSITLSLNGQLLLNGKVTNEEEIKNFSKKTAAEQPEIQAIIAADKDVAHGRVISVIDIVKSAGVKKFAISIDKQ